MYFRAKSFYNEGQVEKEEDEEAEKEEKEDEVQIQVDAAEDHDGLLNWNLIFCYNLHT